MGIRGSRFIFNDGSYVIDNNDDNLVSWIYQEAIIVDTVSVFAEIISYINKITIDDIGEFDDEIINIIILYISRYFLLSYLPNTQVELLSDLPQEDSVYLYSQMAIQILLESYLF